MTLRRTMTISSGLATTSASRCKPETTLQAPSCPQAAIASLLAAGGRAESPVLDLRTPSRAAMGRPARLRLRCTQRALPGLQ